MSFVFVCWRINIRNTNQLSWAINYLSPCCLHRSLSCHQPSCFRLQFAEGLSSPLAELVFYSMAPWRVLMSSKCWRTLGRSRRQGRFWGAGATQGRDVKSWYLDLSSSPAAAVRSFFILNIVDTIIVFVLSFILTEILKASPDCWLQYPCTLPWQSSLKSSPKCSLSSGLPTFHSPAMLHQLLDRAFIL